MEYHEQSNWPLFQDAAEKIFNDWKHHRELKWAECAWSKLFEAGLTDCETELDRTLACIRLMALGGIYKDFCDHAWGEDIPPEFDAWVSYFDLNPFYVGLLLGRQDEVEFLFREPADGRYNNCMKRGCLYLSDFSREEIFRVLCPDPAVDAKKLYLALYETGYPADENENGPWEMTNANTRALKFVTDGLPRQRPYFE